MTNRLEQKVKDGGSLVALVIRKVAENVLSVFEAHVGKAEQ